MDNIRLVEVYNDSGVPLEKNYRLREVSINPENVVCLRSNNQFNGFLERGLLPEGLDSRQQFTTVTVNKGTYGADIVVVGSMNEVENRLLSNRQLLRG